MTQLTNTDDQPFKIVNNSSNSGCGCSTTSIGDTLSKDTPLTDGSLTIDGKLIKFTTSDKNIVIVIKLSCFNPIL